MSFSRIFFYSCLFFLVGILLASFLNPLDSDWAIFLLFFIFVSGLILLIVFYRKPAAVIGFFLLPLVFGIFWEEKYEAEIFPICDIDECDIHYFNNLGRISFFGTVSEEPKEGIKNNKIVLETEKVSINEIDKKVEGKVLIILPLGIKANYGDKLEVEGMLKSPEKFSEDFDWSEYLRKERIYSTVYKPEIKLIPSGAGNVFIAKILSLKEKLKETAQFVPPPEGALFSAIVLGDQSRFSQKVNDDFSRSGLVHINSISGMHIIILFEIFFSLFLRFGFYRQGATVLTLIFLLFYIVMIGASPPAVRAGIMGGFLYLGFVFGRLNQSFRAIVFAATGMVFTNPLILTRDIGFQLSFLASLGIIYFLPIFKKWAKAENSKLKELILLTFAAQIFCLPILIFNFGQVSLLAPISNLLVVPLLPFLLSIGLLYLLFGTIVPFLAVSLSFVLWIFFGYVIKVTEVISSIPFSAIKLNLSWFVILVFYLILVWFIFRFYRAEICQEKVD